MLFGLSLIWKKHNIKLSRRSQTQKATDYMIPFTCHSGKGKSIGIGVRLVAATGCGWRTGLTTGATGTY